MKEEWKTASLEYDALLQRIEKVERLNRRIKVISMVGLFLIAPLFVTGLTLPQTKVYEGTRFVLVDSTKKTRAELVVNAQDQPVLTFSDSSGKVRAELKIDNNGKAELLLKSNDDSKFAKVSTDTSASLIELKNQATRTLINSKTQIFYDSFNTPRAMLGIDDFGQSRLSLQDGSRSRIAELIAHGNRSFLGLGTITNNQRSHATLEAESVGGGNLKLFNSITGGYVALHSRAASQDTPLTVNFPGLLIKRPGSPVYRAP